MIYNREMFPNTSWSVLAAILFIFAFVNLYSLSTLTTKPAVWYDEGINIELARNFSEFGKLDLIVEPLVFSGRGANVGSTGYPVTVPLAGFFKAFGFGFSQARIYMLLWMNIFLISLFYFVKKIWNTRIALLVLLLVVSFPSFYANGRSVMGEIPGLAFLLFALVWYFRKKNNFIIGVFLGLAVVSKPSVYAFFIPAFAALFLLDREDFFKKIINFCAGVFLPFLGWLMIYSEAAFSSSLWRALQNHFINPYAAENFTVVGNIQNNLGLFLRSSTLIYFSFFAAVILLAVFLSRDFRKNNRAVLILAGLYALFQLFFFLKSLGYFRYLIAVQIFIFILLPLAIKIIFERFYGDRNSKIFAATFLIFVVSFQTAYLFTKADIFYSNETQDAFGYLRENFEESSIGVINLPSLASLLPPEKKFQNISTYGLRDLGRNPLSFEHEKLPGVVVFESSLILKVADTASLEKFYRLDKKIGRILIYAKKP
ncbi:MAG: glycosyltransferase family 39 protein [Candidatus Niyogibacteria bacterium]|nr:MAG: glycosyltransferase family 39 protein [Candidatus Niyogibacteria bacterium]